MPEKKSRLPVNPNQQEQLHYNAVLLEEIRSQMSAVIETVDLTRTELNDKIDGVEKRLTDRIEVIEIVVKGNSAKLKEHDQRFEKIDKKLAEHDQRFDRLETKLGEHDQQLSQLNEKMDRVVEKVERHEDDITYLKSAVSQT